jgi:hypothetical protein
VPQLDSGQRSTLDEAADRLAPTPALLRLLPRLTSSFFPGEVQSKDFKKDFWEYNYLRELQALGGTCPSWILGRGP